ncbi:MAG: hypothetical protein Aurels2KO_50810 [Aureliella sp.]
MEARIAGAKETISENEKQLKEANDELAEKTSNLNSLPTDLKVAEANLVASKDQIDELKKGFSELNNAKMATDGDKEKNN